jgi:SNF2 family DNA or RNA helicase
MPRVGLFIADDVGLGKTIEAGLILREMLLRQRIKRVVISCPPSVLRQWQEEGRVPFRGVNPEARFA